MDPNPEGHLRRGLHCPLPGLPLALSWKACPVSDLLRKEGLAAKASQLPLNGPDPFGLGILALWTLQRLGMVCRCSASTQPVFCQCLNLFFYKPRGPSGAVSSRAWLDTESQGAGPGAVLAATACHSHPGGPHCLATSESTDRHRAAERNGC